MAYTITKIILKAIFGRYFFDPFYVPVVKTTKSGRGLSYSIKVKGVSSRKISKVLWRLRQTRVLEFLEEDDDRIKIVLTEQGKKKILEYRFDSMVIKKAKKWDGRWHIVVFDIPENKKSARNGLGEKMRNLGLVPFQKSVWIYPYNCQNEVDFIAEVFGVGKYVHYIVTRSITNDDLLRSKFGL
ncbi:MAG: hypothetical protein HYT38_01155 [Candidatus Sungbacteria bacterium]|uniref:Transcriptional repressor PaaX-like central Cas2-like domain-containing protein n=1 Tax=Candidatus Sungiibacteriota bacterium TaxID=2750080 RepID=A0A931YD95_9BACT|nr:hypothetical protein [Candidatus Sungbacteria bacterium]MBI2465744.1 hypothetical protein [Candidatus Sungbacteria bacterium]